MNDFLNRLIDKRRRLIDALDANKGEVNLDIFEDFYPDQAHFIYELLQNAEDAGATEVTFTLMRDQLICEHNGRRTFDEHDVTSITGINNSTKAKEPDRIGKFGVGFKSVFVYTQSPTVRSGDFSFRIVNLILPEPIAADPALGKLTRFELPFDNPRKLPNDAYSEISAGLNDLAETTLLFLSNLESIKWQIGADNSGEIARHLRSESHFEVVKRIDGQLRSSSHFLKFDEKVPGLDTQRVAVAFPLEFLPGVRTFEPGKPLADQLKITPATPGRVAVFFTAAKETSGLRFHLHGPFVPELSRASVKETVANEPLFKQLAKLSAESLHRIKDLELLRPEFLAVLPNPQDQIPARYERIREDIIAEMKTQPLTPTYSRGHAAADRLIQAKASLKDLLSEADIEYLVDYEDDAPLWAIGAAQKNSLIDHFLAGLQLREWDIDDFVETLRRKTSDGTQYFISPPYSVSGPDEPFMAWLGQKPPEWLQRLYALLHDDSEGSVLSELKSLRIVRLQDGTFNTAAKSFFPGDGHTGDDLPMVDPAIYSSGKSKAQQENAKKFLSDLGVRDVGEAEEVEAILEQRYAKEEKTKITDDRIYLRDLKRFIALTEQQPEKASLFAQYYIFQGADDSWYEPDEIYLDQPYLDTDLSAYYGRLGEEAGRTALHTRYKDCGIEPKRLGKFACQVGATFKLKFKQISCRTNPQWSHLSCVGGDRYTSPIDRDYCVPKLGELLKTPCRELSRLIWRTLTALSPGSQYLRATYQRNQTWGSHTADSQLVHELRAANWVPQGDSDFVRPADASRELLPEGFPFDPGWAWLKAIHFGLEATRQSEQARQKEVVAQSLGFSDVDTLERARRFAALPSAEQETILAAIEKRTSNEMPDRESGNPQRRAQNVRDQAMTAPQKESEPRTRSVSAGREGVKEEAAQYLRQHYTNSDGEMICQICKGPLPFKLDNGTEFFETVEFLPELKKRYYQNYLALCPNHSAMFQLANGSSKMMSGNLEKLVGNELEVILAQQNLTIYFSKTHVADLKVVIDADGNPLAEPDDDDVLDRGSLTAE